MKNNRRYAILASFALLTLLVTGCAGQSAFKQGEKLSREGKLDEAVASYAEAVRKSPDKQAFREKLMQSRATSAVQHLESGRALLATGKMSEALSEFRTASAFDPSLEVAVQEAMRVESQLRAKDLVVEAEAFFRARRIVQAKNTIDVALNLDPENIAAKELLGKINSGNKTVMDGVELDVNSSQPINLKFKATGIKDVFNILSKLSGINFILDEEIKTQTNVTLLLENATFPQALELILQLNKLGKKVLNPKTIIVYPKTKEKEKQFDDQLIQTFYLSNIDAKKAVNLLRTMLQLRKIYVHEELNALIVRDTPEVIKLCGQILAASDRADSEVLFELELIEVTSGDKMKVGAQLKNKNLSFGFLDSTATSIASSLVADSLGDLKFLFTVPTASFDILKTLKDTEVLANPKIRMKNKEKSKILVGTKEPVVTSTLTNDITTTNIQYIDVGVKLDIEPVIQLDNSVFTKLSLEVSSVSGRGTVGPPESQTTVLTITTTNAQTALTLKDGERTIIGGLIRNNKSKTRETIPFLGDLPIIGPLLSNYETNDDNTEILLSITPFIVKNVVIPTVAESTIWSGGEDDLKAGPAFGTFAGSFDPATERLPEKAVPSRQSAAPGFEDEIEGGILENFIAEPEGAVEGSAGALNDAPPAAIPGETAAPAVDAATLAPTGASIAPVGVPPATEETVIPPNLETTAESAPLVQLEPFPLPPAGDGLLSFAGPSAVKVGEEFGLDVLISEGNKLFSAPLFVLYDEALLNFVRAEEGGFLKQDGQSTVFTTSTLVGQGQLIVGYKQGVGATGASGNGTLFRLIFKGKAAGAATVKLDRINFRDPAGQRLKVEPTAMTLEIR